MYTYIYNTYIFEYIQRDAEQWRGRSSGAGGAALCRRGNLTPVCRRQTTMKTTRLRSASCDFAVEGESGLSLSKETFSEPQLLTRLFCPDDYGKCDDQLIVETYEIMTGARKATADSGVDQSRFFVTENQYLMRHDPVTNVMATVLVCRWLFSAPGLVIALG